MEYLILWLGTDVVSYCIEMYIELHMRKKVFDNGYIINTKKLKEMNKKPDLSNAVMANIIMFIPIVNAMYIINKMKRYSYTSDMILEQLKAMDVLEEMNEVQKKEYFKKPTLLNVINLGKKYEKTLQNKSEKEIKQDYKNEFSNDLCNNIVLDKKEEEELKEENVLTNDEKALDYQKKLLLELKEELLSKKSVSKRKTK